jgi:hypothetical protein
MEKNKDCIKSDGEYWYIQEYIPSSLYFIMERVDQNALSYKYAFWKSFVEHEQERFQRREEQEEGIIYSSGQKDGLSGFDASFEFDNSKHQLWIVYAYTSELTSKNQPLQEDKIEMYMSVMTTDTAPMTTHMGIQRSYMYLYNERAGGHSRISVPLHSFAAKIMLIIYPSKLYMITTPVGGMKRTFERLKGLSKHVYVGDNMSKLYDSLNEKKLYVGDLPAYYFEIRKAGGIYKDRLPEMTTEFLIEDLYGLYVDFLLNTKSISDSDGLLIGMIQKEAKQMKKKLIQIHMERQNNARNMESEFISSFTDDPSSPYSSSFLSKEDSPIVLKENGNIFSLYDKSRRDIIFEYDKSKRTAFLKKEKKNFVDETNDYDWFFKHYFISGTKITFPNEPGKSMYITNHEGYLTVDLEALAKYDKPECYDSKMDIAYYKKTKSSSSSISSSSGSGSGIGNNNADLYW